jgi:hypothetical protein
MQAGPRRHRPSLDRRATRRHVDRDQGRRHARVPLRQPGPYRDDELQRHGAPVGRASTRRSGRGASAGAPTACDVYNGSRSLRRPTQHTPTTATTSKIKTRLVGANKVSARQGRHRARHRLLWASFRATGPAPPTSRGDLGRRAVVRLSRSPSRSRGKRLHCLRRLARQDRGSRTRSRVRGPAAAARPHQRRVRHPTAGVTTSASRALGGSLTVAVNSDASVRRLGKGDDRPLNPLDDRLAVSPRSGA